MNTKRKPDPSKRKLIEFLELLDIKSFDSSIKLHLDIFKNPDKELFRKIMCLILVRIGGFDHWLSKYSKPIILAKTEAEFRSSFKDIIPLINERGSVPKANLKLVNQSVLVAPRGPTIVSFLLSLSEYALKVVCNELNYTPPKVEEVDEKLKELKLNTFQVNVMNSEFENEIEMLKDELSQIILLEKSQEDDSVSEMSELTELIKNNPYLYAKLKCNLINLEAIDEAIMEYKTDMENRLVENEKSVNELEDLHLYLSHVKNNLDEMECFRDSKLDGIEFMKILGLKSDVNAVLNIKGFKLIRNGKLDFLSFLKYCNYCLTNDMAMLSNCSALQEFTLNSRAYISRLTVECEEMEKRKIEYQELIDQYTPLVDTICERTDVKDAVSSCEILNVISNCQKNEEKIVIGSEDEEFPLKDFTLPLGDENLFEWILGEDYSLKQNNLNISRKNKNIRFSPSLARKFSAKKLLMKNPDKLKGGLKKPVFDLTPLVGLSMENRRTTLGSPQMARQEIFKSRHTNGKIKPLRPMVPKSLFTTSMPLKDPSKSVSEISSLFLESSKVDLSEEQFLEGISSGSGVSSFKISPKHNKYTISSPDLDQWDKSSSDLSDDSPPVPGPSLPISLPKPSINEYQQEEISSQLNDSTKLLIDKFNRYKNSLNFSD